MKKLIALFIVLLFSLALFGCQDEGESDYTFDIGGANLFVDPGGRYSITYPRDWYYFGTTASEEKITTWHSSGGGITLAIEDWKPNGPASITVLEWAQQNRDRLITEGHDVVQDISPIVNANGNTGYEITVRKGTTEWRIAFFFNNLTEQFDLTFEYDVLNLDPHVIYLTQIIKSFLTTDL
jgi:hypothetical protein